jgi:hypothetical protein
MLLLAIDNITLPSVMSWHADRLASFYHKIGSISPSCPTRAKKQKELDFAYLNGTRFMGVPHAKAKRTDGGLYPRVRSKPC